MLSYEKPEADVLLRRPRNVKKDRLVNWQLIFHAYGIVGMTQTIASFAMSFWYLERQGIPFKELWFSFGTLPDWIDPDYYNEQYIIASSIYFVNLVVMQWFNLIATRTRRLSIFQHPPAFNKETENLYLFPAIIFSLLMAIFWLYPPAIREVIDTAPVPVEYWFLPFCFGLYTIVIDEARRYAVRRWPNSLIAKAAW
jgi:sodium/potassium-transporting ATPase subunit alpha